MRRPPRLWVSRLKAATQKTHCSPMPDVAAAEAPLIEFDRVRKDFGPARPVLQDLSLAVQRGQFVVLTGANGAGKSTVLRLIAGVLKPDGGRVTVAGEEPSRLRGAALIALRRAIGMVPQDLQLLADRTVLENVMLPVLAAGRGRRAAVGRARAALQRVGLSQVDELPEALSGGAQQRAALARAIVNRPALLLVDEPTAYLDTPAAAELLGLLAEFARSGVTIVMASHGEPAPLPQPARRMQLAAGRLAA
jgi:cell division transport system ATP-binding protein